MSTPTQPRHRTTVAGVVRVLGLATVLVLPLAGCYPAVDGQAAASSSATSAPSSAPSETTEPTSDTTEPDPAPAPASAPPLNPGVDPTFGNTYLWGDGLAVAVSEPVDFVPSETSSADPAADYVGFVIAVRNDSPRVHDELISLSLRSRGLEADRLFDVRQDIESTPTDPLPPGQTRTFKVAFGVADDTDLDMDVRPGRSYQEVTFTLDS